MFPEGGEEKSYEELLVEKFKRGDIRILTEDDFEEVNWSDMDMTMISDRRQSVYQPSRKSIVPRKSILPRKSFLPPPTLNESNEEPESPQANKKSENVVRFQEPEGTPSTGAIKKCWSSEDMRRVCKEPRELMEKQQLRSENSLPTRRHALASSSSSLLRQLRRRLIDRSISMTTKQQRSKLAPLSSLISSSNNSR